MIIRTSWLGQISRFRISEFVVTEQLEDLIERRNRGLNAGTTLLSDDATADLSHCRYCSPHGVVGPDHCGNVSPAICRHRGSIVLRWNDHDRQLVLPGARKREDLVCGGSSRVNEDRIGSCVSIGVGARNCVVNSVPGDERLDTRHKDQIVRDCIFYSAQAARELVNVGERMSIANQRICFRETAVFQRDAGRATLAEFASQQTSVVEVPEAAIPVDQDRKAAAIHDPPDYVDKLAPRCFIGIAVAQRGGNRQPRCPEPLKPARSAIAAERPSCASIRNESSLLQQIWERILPASDELAMWMRPLAGAEDDWACMPISCALDRPTFINGKGDMWLSSGSMTSTGS